jgi:hypothetical protein
VDTFSAREGPLVNADHSSSEITLAFLLMEVAMRKAKSILSFSKSPLVTFLKISFVIPSIKFYNLFSREFPF